MKSIHLKRPALFEKLAAVPEFAYSQYCLSRKAEMSIAQSLNNAWAITKMIIFGNHLWIGRN